MPRLYRRAFPYLILPAAACSLAFAQQALRPDLQPRLRFRGGQPVTHQ